MSALAVVVALVVGACAVVDDESESGTDEGDNAADVEDTDLRLPGDLGRGCGEAASTDPHDLRPDRVVARCAPGAPPAEPLGEEVTLRVGVDDPGEGLAPLLLADHFGELADEGLSVDLVEVESLKEAYEALADGAVDAVAGDLHGRFLDMAVEGAGARLVLGGPVPAAADDQDAPQAGLWVASRVSRWRDLEHRPVAVGDGISGASAYPLMDSLLQGELSLNDVDLVMAGGMEAAQKLLAGEVDAAWLEGRDWQVAAEGSGFELAVTRPPEALGGLVVHERLRDPARDREVGLALVRALIRTINTYLPAGYRQDGEVIAALAEVTGWTREELEAGPPLVFDWEVRAGTVERMQGAMLPLGAVVFEDLHDEEAFVDRSLYEEAVGGPRPR